MPRVARSALPLLLSLACTSRPLAGTDTADATDTGSTGDPAQPTTGAPPITTDPGPTPDPATSEPGSSGVQPDPQPDPSGSSSSGGWIFGPDVPPDFPCDTWVQDCPDEAKCMPVSQFGSGTWDWWSCVPIAPQAGALGDPCEVLGDGLDGLDTCAEGLMCWPPFDDVEERRCIALCTGSPETPTCPPGTTCVQSGDGVLTACIPGCDPLAQDCLEGEVCIQDPSDAQHFLCVFDASEDEGQALDPCEFANACDPGLSCLDPALAAECDPAVVGCCLPFCDLSVEPDLCPGAGQACVPWFEEGAAPPGLGNLGVCALP